MKKNIIVFVNAIRPATFAALRKYRQKTGRQLQPLVLVDKHIQASITNRNGQKNHAHKVQVVSADFDSAASVRQALKPYQDRILAVTSQYENSIHELKKLIPYFPYLPMPSESSLDWATEKKHMRQMLEAYNAQLVPKYIEVGDDVAATIAQIQNTMVFPLIVKPSGLEGSLLVTRVDTAQELRTVLHRTRKEVQKAYNTWIKRQVPSILVEEFMEGDMYSIDVYVNHAGICVFTPVVKVITGRKAGFDDFFGYVRLTPALLDATEVAGAQTAAERACRALGLRSVTAHVELMHTSNGWKIIELGPRIGGYRHDMYDLSYGINHIVNDVLNRAGETPAVPDTTLRHTAVFNMYAHTEGTLESVDGLEQINSLPSYVSCTQTILTGDEVLFARNNGDPILEVTLSHPNRYQLEADMRQLESSIGFKVATKTPVHALIG